MAKLGFRTMNEMVGRADRLRMNDSYRTFKTGGLDLTPILMSASEMRPDAATYNVTSQKHALAERKDNQVGVSVRVGRLLRVVCDRLACSLCSRRPLFF